MKRQMFTLWNDMKVFLVPDKSLGFVEMQGVTLAGKAFGGATPVGLLTPDMLMRGSEKLSREEWADFLDRYALEFSAYSSSTSPYHMGWEGRTLPAYLTNLFSATCAFVSSPVFPDGEIEILKTQAEASVRDNLDDPAQRAKHASRMLLFERGHPYAIVPADDFIGKIRALKRDDFLSFHAAHYLPNVSAIILVGSLNIDESLKMLEGALGSWEPKEESPQIPSLRSLQQFVREDVREEETVFIPDKSDAVVELSRRTPLLLTSPDYAAAKVAVAIIGGDSWSRLYMTVREKLGLSYSVFASLRAGNIPGYFQVTAHTNPDNIQKTELAILEVIGGCVEKGVSEEEIGLALAFLRGRQEYGLASYRGIARECALDAIFGKKDVSRTFLKQAESLTVQEVSEAARKYFDPSKMKIVRAGTIK